MEELLVGEEPSGSEHAVDLRESRRDVSGIVVAWARVVDRVEGEDGVEPPIWEREPIEVGDPKLETVGERAVRATRGSAPGRFDLFRVEVGGDQTLRPHPSQDAEGHVCVPAADLEADRFGRKSEMAREPSVEPPVRRSPDVVHEPAGDPVHLAHRALPFGSGRADGDQFVRLRRRVDPLREDYGFQTGPE